MNLVSIAVEFNNWLESLPPEFLFLFALPFVVAAVGLLADRRDPPGYEDRPLRRVGVPAGVAAALAVIAVGAE